jgi:GH24 family phage-related lysozyme (muramidase)
MDDETRQAIKDLIERHEGRRDQAYDDKTGEPLEPGDEAEGHPTVGVGFNLDRAGARDAIEELGLDYDKVRSGEQHLTDEQIDTLFDADVQTAIDGARDNVSNFDELSADRQAVVTDMAFNLGDKLSQFENAIDAIEKGDWQTAAEEMLDSAWADQVGARATDDANLMSGEDS